MCSSALGISEIAACPPSPISDSPLTLPSPTSSLSRQESITLLACSLDVSPYIPAVVLYYCTFQGIVLQDLKCFLYFLCLFFMCLCEKYYKPITIQFSIVDCISGVPRLTLLGLEINWTYKCALRIELIHM